jgi:hypothetical protein
MQVQAQVRADGRACAYCRTAHEGLQFVLYDLKTARRTGAFDHAGVAKTLSKAMDEPLTFDQLPIQHYGPQMPAGQR